MQDQNEMSDSISVAMLLGASVAVLLIVLWLVSSVVTSDFSVSPMAIRTLLVLTSAGCVAGYFLGKFAFARKDFAPSSNLRLIPSSRNRKPVAQLKREHPHSAVKRRPAS